MAFAIIETGGKQYRVLEGQEITIEKLTGERAVGDKVVFDKVLLLDDGTEVRVGDPYLAGVSVEAELTEMGKGKKLHIRKFKAKSNRSRKIGHRQPYHKVKVAAIKA